MRILVAVDESSSTEDVLRAIVAQIRPQGADVRVLHVLQAVAGSPPQMSAGYAPELEPFAKLAKDLLSRATKTLSDAGFKAEAVLMNGDIRETIIDTAAEWGADLIILGSHNHSGAHRFLLGSVAESVARHAACSVEIVRISRSH